MIREQRAAECLMSPESLFIRATHASSPDVDTDVVFGELSNHSLRRNGIHDWLAISKTANTPACPIWVSEYFLALTLGRSGFHRDPSPPCCPTTRER